MYYCIILILYTLHFLTLIGPVVEVDIFDMDDNAMDTTTVYELNVGDYIECRAAEAISEDYPPRFVWWRSVQVANTNGPKLINYQNTEENHNR